MTQSSGRIGLLLGLVLAVTAGIFVFRGLGASTTKAGADVAISCAPSQRAVVRQTVSAGNPRVDIQCVDGGVGQTASYVVDGDGQLVPMAQALPMAATPIAYAAASPAVYQPQVTAAPVVYEAPVQARAPQRQSSPVRARKGSTWQKRALVIGGSAGAGAGVGALIGGKKGALIGGVVGGGGAALVDALRNR